MFPRTGRGSCSGTLFLPSPLLCHSMRRRAVLPLPPHLRAVSPLPPRLRTVSPLPPASPRRFAPAARVSAPFCPCRPRLRAVLPLPPRLRAVSPAVRRNCFSSACNLAICAKTGRLPCAERQFCALTSRCLFLTIISISLYANKVNGWARQTVRPPAVRLCQKQTASAVPTVPGIQIVFQKARMGRKSYVESL